MSLRCSASPLFRNGCMTLALLTACGSSGCGGGGGGKQSRTGAPAADGPVASRPGSSPSTARPSPTSRGGREPKGAARKGEPRRSLADLVAGRGKEGASDSLADDASLASRLQGPAVDDSKAAAEGIRRLAGKHFTLYTDVPTAPDVDELPLVFDQAVLQWCEYFQAPAAMVRNWSVIGCVMRQRERFLRVGLLPSDLPPFPHGYQRANQLWIHEQPSVYYRRHLLLHEGTHVFMLRRLGGVGPPWYMEGTAELLATHRWEDGRLQLRYFPKSREEAPQWGRVKIIQDEFAAGRLLAPEAIMAYDRDESDPAAYGWCWALAAFLDNHPRYQQPFRQLRDHVEDYSPAFSQSFRDLLAPHWSDLVRQWQLFVANMEYGYDVSREAIESRPSAPIGAGGASVRIAADRGWQSSGIWLEEGAKYRITATGRYQVADQPATWWCEPGGVTIRYWKGRPLGMLLASVCDDRAPPQGVTPLASPEPIGLEREMEPKAPGVLYLRINESPAELADNAGELFVRIAPN